MGSTIYDDAGVVIGRHFRGLGWGVWYQVDADGAKLDREDLCRLTAALIEECCSFVPGRAPSLSESATQGQLLESAADLLRKVEDPSQ